MSETATRPGAAARPSGEPSPIRPTEVLRLPEPLSYRIKNRLLGPPLTSDDMATERLGKVAALGVLAPDCISSSAYGTEEMLRILVPVVGVAAFTLVLPVTGAILLILLLVTLSYREVVMVYTRAGGSYVVARDNFGPKIAQIAAAALIIDYTITVAVQVAAGTAAVVSLDPKRLLFLTVPLSVAVVLVMTYGNLRGIREASKAFAFPTYFFIFSMGVMIIVGLIEVATGHLHAHPFDVPGAVPPGRPGVGLLEGASVFLLAKSFANGGSSLTGLEAISNGVSAFRPPNGPNARRTLVMMSTTLGFLVAGVSLLAHFTHAVPYISGAPTVVAQEARDVFHFGLLGQVLYVMVVISNVAILYTGGNTSFNGFPFLASFVAQDAFLPRFLTKRGHRLSFSNGILVLSVVAIALLVVTRANVDSLVAVYAIGVFVGFTMAGAGMVRHHRREREPGWRHKTVVNGGAAVLSAIVVVVFSVTKFTQGVWIILILFPLLVWWFIRINRRYRLEAAALEAGAAQACAAPIPRRHVVILLVDRLDLASARALQYARSLGADRIRIVHFRIDPRRARELEEAWGRVGLGGMPLELLDCPDRRLGRATLEVVAEELADRDTEVTVLLPRRDFAHFTSRILHDHTADRISLLVGQLPHANATIVPFQLTPAGERIELADRLAPADAGDGSKERVGSLAAQVPDAVPIASVAYRRRAKIAGQITSVRVQPQGGQHVLLATVEDGTGGLTLVFGRRRVEGIEPSARIVAEGMVGEYDGHLAIWNPSFDFVVRPSEDPLDS